MDFATILERYGLAAVITLVVLFRVIPKMLDTFKSEQEANRKAWTDQMTAERKDCREDNRAILIGLSDLDKKNDNLHQQTRHDLRDFAQVAINEKAIAEAIRRREAGEPRSGG